MIRNEFLIFTSSICDILLFIIVVFQQTHKKGKTILKPLVDVEVIF